MKLHLPKGLRTALIAAIAVIGFTLPQTGASTTNGYNIIVFGENEVSWADYRIDLDGLNNDGLPKGEALGDSGVTYTFNISGGKIWSHGDGRAITVPDTWCPEAIATMNTDMGTSLTTTDLNGLHVIASAAGGTITTFILNGSAGIGDAKISNGDTITLYLGIAGTENQGPANYNITGLEDATIMYATADADFSSTPQFTNPKYTLTLLQVTGTVSDASAISMYPTNVNNEKTGLAFVAYHSVKGVASDYLWSATGTSANWGDAVWTLGETPGQTITDNAVAIFDTTATAKTVNITDPVTAKRITVSDNYTFAFAEGSGMTATKLSIDPGQTLTVSGPALVEAGTLDNKGTLSIGAGTRLTAASAIDVAAGSAFNVEGAGTLALPTLRSKGGSINITSNLEVTGGGDGTMGNNQNALCINSGAGGSINILAGVTNVTGAVYTGGGSTETAINVGTGTDNATLVATRIELGDTNGSTSRFTIGEKGKVVVLSSEDVRADQGNPQKKTGLQLAEWNQVVTSNISGKLYAQNATAFMSNDNSSVINVTGGTMAVKGIATTNAGSTRAHTLTVDGGKLIMGERGIAAEPGDWTITFTNAEIGTTNATTEVGRNFTISGNITFNTAMYEWTGENATLDLEAGESGGTITVSGNVTGDGTLIVKGTGTVTMTGANNAITHTIDLQGGTLDVSSAVLDISDMSGGGSTTYSDGQVAGNGFATVSGTVDVVNVGTGATLNHEGVQVLFNGASLTMDDNGDVVMEGTKSLAVFYVNVGGSAESLANAVTKGEGELTTVNLGNNTTLTADAAADLDTLVVRADASATVALGQDLNIGAITVTTADKALTLDGAHTVAAGALSGAGNIVLTNGSTLALTGISATYTGSFTADAGSTLQLATTSYPDTLTVSGDGNLRLLVSAGGQNTDPKKVVAKNLYLAADADHNSRVRYVANTDFSEVGHLYFDGGQLWLNAKDMTGDNAFTGDVTFGTTVYKEGNAFGGAALRVDRSATFSGAVEVKENTKFTWGANTTVEFGGAVTGTGNIELARYGGTGTFLISGNGAAYGGALTSNANVGLKVATSGTLTLAGGSDIAGAVTLDGGTLTMNSAADTTSTISGAIGGTGTLVKTGAGILVLSGAPGTTSTETIAVNEGTLKASTAGTLGTGALSVAAGATLDLIAGDAMGGTQTVANSGSVTLHNTLTSGTVNGGVLTLATDFPNEGEILDVDDDTTTGNGFSQGGVMHVYDPTKAALEGITDIVHGETHYQLSDIDENGDITDGSADWYTYQLNGEAQYAVQAIMDYATSKGGELKTISVNGDMLWLVDDSTAFKASMLSGTDEHLQLFSLMLDDGAALGMDADVKGGVYLSTDTESHATINLEKDVTVGMGLEAYNEGSASNLTIDGAHTLSTPYFGVESGTATLQGGAHLVVTEADGFGVYIGDTLTVKGASEISIPNTGIKSVDGAKDAVLTNDSSEYAYDIADPGFTLADAELTVGFADAHELGNVLSGAVAVVNAGAGTLTDVNTVNLAYDGLHAQGGNIVLQGRGEDVAVRNLTVDAGRSVSRTDTTAGIVVNGTATFGNGSTVGSALTMAGGSTLDGTAALGSHALSIESGVNIGESLWSTLTALDPEASTNIFTGVSALTLAGAEYTEDVDLNTIFTHASLKPNKYTLGYKDGNVIVTKLTDNNRYWKGGSGTWNTTSTVWTDEDGADTTFTNEYNAYFTGGTNGTVTLGENITAGSITVSGADYIFDPGDHTLTVNNAVEADGHKATFNMDLSGTGLKLTAKNGGTITLASGSVKDVEVATDGTIRTSGTLTVADGFTNAGKLVQADTLTIQKGTAAGGNVTAVAALNLTSGQSYTFGNLKAGTVNGTGANLTIGETNTLTVDNNSVVANLTLGNGATVAGSSTMNTAGVTLQGDATVTGKLAVSGMIAGTGCTLKIENGELSAAMLSSGVGLATSGTSTITSTGVTLALKDTVDNASDGTVTFVGNFEVGHCDTVDGTATYVGGGSTANGFKQAQKIVSVIDEGTAVGTAANLTYNGKAIGQMNTSGKVTFQGDTEYDKFYVNSGTENASTALDNPSQRLGTFELKAGTTLVADRDIDISRVNAEGAATLDIAAGTTVTSAGQSKTLTLKGAGTFALNSGVSTPGVALDSAWAGTVSFTEAALTTLKGSWKSGSTVSLTGVTGSLGNDLIEATVVLNKGTGDWGFGQTETSGTQYTNLEGTLTGDGNLGVKGGSVSSTFNLDGDIDGWTGNFIVATAAETDLNLNGTAKTVHGTVSGSNLTVNVQADTTFEGALNVDVIHVDNTKAATLKADSTARWVDAYNGTLKVNDGKTLTVTDTAGPEGLTLGAGARIVLPGAAYLGGEDYGYIGGTVANGTSGDQAVGIHNTNITVTGTTLRVNGGTGFTVDNKLVDATLAVENGLPSTVTLNNVQDSLEVAGDLEIGPGGSLKVANGGSKQTLNISDGTTLTLANDTTLDADLTLNRGATLKLDYNMGSPVATTLNGGGLTLYKGLTLSGDLFETLKGLSMEGESVTLFSNVGTIVFDGATTTTVDASTYFTNLLDLEGDYTFNYREGLLSIVYSESSSRQLVWDGTETEHRWVAYEPETITPDVKDWYQPSTETETHFVQGDTATFGSDAETKVVNLSAGETTAKMVTIKEAADYEFVADAAGSKLSATRFEVKEGATLNKSGAGTLILEVGENVTVDAAGLFVDEGELVIGTAEMPSTLAFDNGVMEVAEGATLRVAKIQDSEGSLIAVSGTLNVASGSLHAIHALEGSSLVISAVNGVSAGTLTIGSDTTLHGLENHGTLDVGMHALTLAETAAQGGNVTAGTLNLVQNGNAFGNLKVNTIHYAYGAEGEGALGTVNVDTIAANGGFPVITLDLTDTMGAGGSLAPTQRTGEATTYTLIHSTTALGASLFTLNAEALDLLKQNGLLRADAGLVKTANDVTLTVGGLDLTWYTDNDVTEWGYKVVNGDALAAGANTLNGVQHVVVEHSRTVDVTGVGSAPGLRVRNITGPDGRTITFTGTKTDTVNLITTEETASNVNVAAQNITLKVGLDALDEMDPVDYKDLRVGAVSLTGATLDVHAHEGLDDSFTVDSLNGDADSMLKGTLIVEGTGGAYRGSYGNAYVGLHEEAEQTLCAGEGLTIGGLGIAKLVYTGTETHMDGIEGIGMTVVLNSPEASNIGSTLVLDNTSWLANGLLVSGMSAMDSALTLDSADVPDLLDAPGMRMDGTTILINADATDEANIAMAVNDGGKKQNLLLAYIGADDSYTDDVQLNGYLYNKYYENARLEGGELRVDRRRDFYTADVVQPTTENGKAGSGMLDDALLEINPQISNPAGDLAAVMTALETGAVANPDRVAAAVAGASAAALGAAYNNDVQRQLNAIRNRTTTMGLADCTNHEGLPYVNAWVNAEGDYRKLDADNTLAGYTLSSWGGTLGCDVDLTNRLTLGAAFTVMHGDFTAHSADMAQGDLDRDYVSLFARYGYHAWAHTFVATFGYAKSKVDRTVNYGPGSYSTRDNADGNAFGFMYEVGYTKALSEDASTCLQPVFNVSYRHSSLGGYTEEGASDAALNVGDADMDAITFGLGARLQSIVGTSVYNRATLFEGRVLAKFDAGDRDCTTTSSLLGVAAKRSVKSAEVGAVGVEVGAGLTIPVGETGGSIFLDVSGDFRAGATEFNGAAGYRFSF